MRSDLPDTPLVRARKALETFKATFEDRKRTEFIRESALLQAAIDQQVWAMREAGKSVYAIKAAYGTKDTKTITDILTRMEARVPAVKPEFEVTRTDKPNYYQVSDGTHTVFVWGGDDSVAPYKYARALDTDSANALGLPMRDPAHPAWAYVREAEGK